MLGNAQFICRCNRNDADDVCIIEERFGDRRVNKSQRCPSGSSPPDLWTPPASGSGVGQLQVRPRSQQRGATQRTILAVVTLDDEDTVSSSSSHLLPSGAPRRKLGQGLGQSGLDLVVRGVAHKVN